MPAGDVREAVRRAIESVNLRPTALPDITDEAVILAQYRRKRQLASMRGRSATFLTGPRGLGGPSSEIATSFLRAALEPPAPWPVAPTVYATRPAPLPPRLEEVPESRYRYGSPPGRDL